MEQASPIRNSKKLGFSMKPTHKPPQPEPSANDDPSDCEREAYTALRGLAAAYLHAERANHTLQPTALVHEAYIKLAGRSTVAPWKSQTHFQAVAARAMRQILVDHARQRATKKRGGDRFRITLAPDLAATTDPDIELLALDEALQQLAVLDERKALVVELRFFGGLTCAEAADRLRISPKTAEADWYFARAWLRAHLEKAGE